MTSAPSAPGRASAEVIARGLRAVADPTRLQVLRLILASPEGRRAVTELARELGLTQPTLSHHLRVLADEGLVTRTQDGRRAWYSIARDRLAEVHDAIGADADPSAVDPPLLRRIAADLSLRFTGVFSAETVEKYVTESYHLLAQRAKITRHLPSLTSRFAADRLRSLADADGLAVDAIPDVLFVCVQNAGRSQLASAILRSLAGDRVRVLTAGSEPSASIDPLIITALDEIGVPVGGEFPKPLTDEVVRAADFVITMGCGDACPIYPGRRYLDWDLPDPAGLTLAGVRQVRDTIDGHVRRLLAEMNFS
ncbi:MAG: metalloregulator ArsR/SmtB family transcription factor [Pseudolysinimonas sp.]